jgi:DNA-binding XRE family transcriptional regulator
VKIWSWVNQPENRRPEASGPGRYSRPLAVRDQVIAAAFGKEVKRLRLLAQMSTRELAGIVGMSQPSIVMLEKDKGANIELRLMWDFAEAFSVEPDHFMQVCQGAVQIAETKRLRQYKPLRVC